MIVGIGVDLVRLQRFGESLKRPGFAERVFTLTELAAAPTGDSTARRTEHLAGLFAAKEALAKALAGTPGLVWTDAQVNHQENGQPYFCLDGSVKARAEALKVRNMQLSISHDEKTAVAFVVLEA
ncbi:MAG: holo-ACP synthase [Propionibacteriaceae bacterium]|nr:holo-ACP synthase [Propionibacteriaceae bacterium]